MIHWLQAMYHWHPVLMGAIGMAIANAAITTMPSPDSTSGKGYIWLFNFLHAIVLSLARIAAQYNQEPPKA